MSTARTKPTHQFANCGVWVKVARYSLSKTLSVFARQLAPELYLPQPENWPLEKLARDQELALFIHNHTPKIRPRDSLFWVLFRQWFPLHWKANLHIVEPDTVVRCHKLGYRLFWRWKSRARKTGRKQIGREMPIRIRQMATENPTWGAPRIHGERLKLGFAVDERTVSRYLKRIRPDEKKRQSWRTFLKNHAPVTAAMDFMVVPTATFGLLYALVVIHHGRREILHVNVTEHPTAAWVSQQLREAFPGDVPLPKYLIHDNDTVFGNEVKATLKNMGIKSKPTSYRSPSQNSVAERFIGSVRRDLLDHVIVLGDRHLVRLLRRYLDYYHDDRTHLTLAKDAPRSRPIETRPHGGAKVISLPRIGGLHHRYVWQQAA